MGDCLNAMNGTFNTRITSRRNEKLFGFNAINKFYVKSISVKKGLPPEQSPERFTEELLIDRLACVIRAKINPINMKNSTFQRY